MIRQLHTVDEVISELGGNQAVRELIPRKAHSAVLTWKFRKKFPATTYAVMKAALEAKGARAPESLWGMKQPAEAAE